MSDQSLHSQKLCDTTDETHQLMSVTGDRPICATDGIKDQPTANTTHSSSQLDTQVLMSEETGIVGKTIIYNRETSRECDETPTPTDDTSGPVGETSVLEKTAEETPTLITEASGVVRGASVPLNTAEETPTFTDEASGSDRRTFITMIKPNGKADEASMCPPHEDTTIHSNEKLAQLNDPKHAAGTCGEDDVAAVNASNSGQGFETAAEETTQMQHPSRRTTQRETKTATQSHAQTGPASSRDFSNENTSGSLLDNIVESTRCLIHHSDPRLHVSTYAEREALKILRRYGSVLVTGKSGSGKSRIGFRLLSEIERSTQRIPLVLTSYRQWHHIPQDRNKNKYVVFIDDIFGSSHLVEPRMEGWGKLFDLMNPAVESGHVMLVLSSGHDIYRKYPNRLKQHPVIQNSDLVFLDEHKYALRQTEKAKFIQKYCSKMTNLQREDIDRLTTFEPPLGFPQCCVFFAQNKSVQERGVEFFQKPFEFIARDVCMFKETDPVGYLVLLLVIMMENRLETRLLTKPSTEFKEMIEEIANTCISVFRPPSCAQIRDKLRFLKDVYLFEFNQVISFQHQSVFDAVFVNAAPDNQEMFLQHSPTTILLDFVSIETIEHTPGIHVEDDMFPTLAKRITELMLSSDANIIMDHPSLKNPHFVKTISTIWTQDILFKLSHQQVKEEHLRMWVFNDNRSSSLTESSMQELETDFFVHKEVISALIMKGLGSLANLLIPEVKKQYVLDEALMCAFFMQDMDVVLSLLARGACINDEMLTVACCAKPKDRNVTDLAFHYFKSQEIVLQKPDRKLSLAIQQGNIFAVEHLVDVILTHEDSGDIFSKGLQQLMFQCGKVDLFVPYVPSTSIPVVEILQLLLSTTCSYDMEEMVSAAVRHEESSSLKYLLDFIEDQSLSCNINESLYDAESVKLLLEKGAFEKRSLIAAAQSSESSSEKIRLLLTSLHDSTLRGGCTDLSQIVNFEENGNVSLHFAVVHCNSEAVNLLLNSGADMNIENHIGMTSFHLAAFTSNAEILELCLKKLCQGRNVSYKGPVTHFVVETVQHMSEETNRKGLMLEILKFVPKTEVEQKKALDLLVHFGIDINELDEDGRSAIFVAAAVGSTQMVKYLHAKGARLDVVSTRGRTLLHEAAKYGDLEMVSFLCHWGSEVNIQDDSGQSVLKEAAGSDFEAFEKINYLQDVCYAVFDDARGSFRQTIPFDNIEVAQYLIDQVLNVAELNDIIKDAFFQACKQHSPSILEYIMKLCNGEINLMTSKSPQLTLNVNTGLHMAVQTVTTKGPGIVKLLLENGADVCVTNEEGNTALLLSLITLRKRADSNFDYHTMLFYMHFRMTGLSALKKRADARIKEFDDLVYSKHLQIIKVLIEEKADVSAVNNSGHSPLHLACQINHPTSVVIVRLLTSKDANVDARDESGNTALHYAVENDCSGNHEMIEALMDAGTDVNAKNGYGNTAIDVILNLSRRCGGGSVKEMRKLKIILDRCCYIEGKNRDMLYSEIYATCSSTGGSYFG